MLGPVTSPCDNDVIRGTARDAAGCAEHAKPWVLATSIVASSMAFIDGSVVSVALPALQQNLHIAVREAQWVVNAYMLMLGALILAGGGAGDRFGRRRVFMLGIVLFAASSALCGVAPSASILIAARMLQGIGAALLVPNSLALISAAFPENERGKAIGTWAAASALTTALGPVLGGWLVDLRSWRLIFLINIPVAIVAWLLALLHVPESRDESASTTLDWRGALLATTGLGALAYGLTSASAESWSHPAVLAPTLCGVVVLCAFVWSEARAREPMMPLALFRSANFSGANLITLFLYFALSGVLFFVPFQLIRIQGYSTTLAGAAFLPFSLIMGALSRWSGGLIEAYGARAPLIVGSAITALGLALFATAGIERSYWTSVFPAMVVLGLGMGVAVAPLTTAVMRDAGKRYTGVASGINNATARVAGLLAVALLGSIAVGIFGTTVNDHLQRTSLSPEISQALREEVPKLAEAQAPAHVQGVERQQLETLLKISFLHSFRVIVLICAGVALLSTFIAAVMIKPAARSNAANE
jgi:EmrB/QacA subfamily drug resistance transporter